MITRENNLQYPLRLEKVLDGFMNRSTEIHRSILDNQSTMLQAISRLSSVKESLPAKQVVFSRKQLEEFSVGSIARCFGEDYAILDQRPTPRIPNGRLLLIDRVIDIAGTRMEIAPPASIVSEVDVPPDAWYLQSNPYDGLPLAILMEMSLQPCGLLSAYLGASLVIPPENHVFRNLDGSINLTKIPDLRGKTITNRAELIKSVASGGLFIQTYRFALSVENKVFLEGESSFGYFTPTLMKNQSGLDLGDTYPRMVDVPDFPAGFFQIKGTAQASKSLLDLTEKTWVNSKGGKFGLGVVIGERNVNPNDWFFANHFFNDPVMPGSMGVESIMRRLTMMIGQFISNDLSTNLVLEFPKDEPLIWKYRGQVVPVNKQTYFEAHVKQVSTDAGRTQISADADFWVDGLRIYSVKNLSFILKEG